MKLIEPTNEYCRQIRAYRKEFLDCGDSMDGTHGLRDIEGADVETILRSAEAAVSEMELYG